MSRSKHLSPTPADAIDWAGIQAQRAEYEAGTKIFTQGDPATSVMYVAHGTVRFSFHFDNDATFRIEADWNVRLVKRLCLQIPLIVKRGGTLLIDGAAVSTHSKCHENRFGTVKVQGQSPESSITLAVPKNVESRVHYPLIPLKYYIDPVIPDTCKPPFHIALVSCQWTNPAETGSAVWSCSVG